MTRNYRRYFEKDVSGGGQADKKEPTPMYTYIKNIANTSSSSKATEPKHGGNSINDKKASVKGKNILYIYMYLSFHSRYESFNNFILSLGSNYARYFKIPTKSTRKLNVARKVTLANNNPRNRKTANDNKTNFKNPTTNKVGIINRNPSSMNIAKTQNLVRNTVLSNNNQRKAAKNYSRSFPKHIPTRSRVNEKNPTAIKVKKQTQLPLLKSGNSKDIKTPFTNKSSVIGRKATPTKVARPTSFQSRTNPSNKLPTKQGE